MRFSALILLFTELAAQEDVLAKSMAKQKRLPSKSPVPIVFDIMGDRSSTKYAVRESEIMHGVIHR